jgi:hypothetical protein
LQSPQSPLPAHFECVEPILRVEDMARNARDDVDVLGFGNAPWRNADFTHVGRDGRGIDLCRGAQGRGGAWVWIGVGDVRALDRVYRERGAVVLQEPKNEPWALEVRIEDPDGNVLRFGSEPEDSAGEEPGAP